MAMLAKNKIECESSSYYREHAASVRSDQAEYAILWSDGALENISWLFC